MSNFEENEKFDDYEELDIKVINFINMINNKENEKIPEPKYFTVSTQSAMCRIDNVKYLDLSKTVVFIAKNIINNIILNKNKDYLIRGIVVDNLVLRFDEIHLKKYKNPIIKHMGINIDLDSNEDILTMLDKIDLLANTSLKKHGRQKKKDKENEVFYNSCSLYVKAGIDKKCVCVKLFNNGEITLTGAKEELDGQYASTILLESMKEYKEIFLDLTEKEVNDSRIVNYRITMINTDFDTNFKIDLLKLLNILNNNEKELFTKFNPEKYRGLIIGYYWNSNKEIQDGKCLCKSRCNGKGCGNGDGQCKKITISIFKSGSVIITGGRLIKQVEDSYKSINSIFKKYYHDIIKLSILDFMNDQDNKGNKEKIEKVKKEKIQKVKKVISEKKIVKIKKKDISIIEAQSSKK
jgi:TATA-box binding protein (TBP) (component of TFIID and TFIIIB)